jgi:peptide/nickel transport system substrate-binding protein
MALSYWERFANSRLTRRRALAGSAAVGVGAVALSAVGCGGGSSGGGGEAGAPAAGLLTQPVDTTKQAKAGGIWKSLTGADVTNFDPLSSQSFTTQITAGYVYPRLLKIIPGVLKGSAGDVEPDLAESYEISGDKLQITLHLRQNMKWDSRSPTNARPVTAEDVVFSWNKFASLSPYSNVLANAKSKDAAVLSMTATDAKTVVAKLAFTDAAALTMLGSSAALYIMPKESDGGFDPKGDVRGAGPWVLESYKPSGGFTYAKNPNWYRTDVPFFDKLDYPIVPEYASQLAQFRAGNIYDLAVHAEDILSMKNDLPQLTMRQGSFNRLWFNSWFGYSGNSPFKDERVRQAWSMSYDRDLWIQAIGATDVFTKTGLPVATRWHSHFPSGWEGWWVDPQDEKAFGANAKYFKFDPTGAKQLLSAAGFSSGVDANVAYISTLQYGTTFPNQAQIQVGFANDVGFKTKTTNPDYQTDWLNKYYYGKGAFDGIAIGADNPELDPGVFMFLRFHPSGGRFKGFSPDGSDPSKGDQKVTDMINAIRQEFDVAKRKDIAKQYQQYMAQKMYAIPFPGQSAGFALNWPALGNAGVYNVGGEGYGAGTETLPFYWLDQTKAPIKS